MKSDFFSQIEEHPIIAAVHDLTQLEKAVKSPCKIVFLLSGDILNIKDLVNTFKDNGKLVFIHLDLIGGFSKDTKALEYIHKYINPDGIISTKSNLIRAAKDLNIFTIQRIFLLDSLALISGIHSIKSFRPDAVEILPGIMPKIIKQIKTETKIPIIAGGLIQDKQDVIQSLNAGAVGISTSNKDVWYL
ncbi:MAG: glycerol-3-phosphate responsive antiterminator [Tissierellia bacterium]|nr:glycerol-3-phosphate responsive antiterminator [Tissierellia bacterium]